MTSRQFVFLSTLLAVELFVTAASTVCAAPNSLDALESDRIIVSVDVALERSDHQQGTRSNRRSSNPYSSIIEFLAEAHNLEFLDAWTLSSIQQTLLVFRERARLSDSELERISTSHRFIDLVQRVQILTTKAEAATRVESSNTTAKSPDVLGVSAAHRWSTGKGVRIAVIDTGADRRHPELRKRITDSKDFAGLRMRNFNNEAHGTMIASIIGGARNGTRLSGVAPDSELLLLRACKQRNAGYYDASCDSVAIARALDYAITNKVQIINLSITGTNDSLLGLLIREALDRGIVVVSTWDETGNKPFPGSMPGVLPVFSAVSPRAVGTPKNALQAPGKAMLGALPGKSYGTMQGSSAATAIVSGVVALLLQRKPHMDSGVIIEQLQRSVDSSSGAIHVCRAVADAIGVSCANAALSQGQ